MKKPRVAKSAGEVGRTTNEVHSTHPTWLEGNPAACNGIETGTEVIRK